MKKKKVGILIHSHLLSAKAWKDIWFGQPPYKLGRAAKGVLLALEEKATLVFFGTGASKKDGMIEGEYTRHYLLEHFFELGKFEAFKRIDLLKAKKFIEKISVSETKSQNTMEEIEAAGRYFKRAGVETVILVSSPTHISRCIKDACIVFNKIKELKSYAQNVFATPSDVSYFGVGPEDVAIVEPPHRTDRLMDNLNILVNKIIKLPADKRKKITKKIESLLKEK
jgi:hypothetical protein